MNLKEHIKWQICSPSSLIKCMQWCHDHHDAMIQYQMIIPLVFFAIDDYWIITLLMS